MIGTLPASDGEASRGSCREFLSQGGRAAGQDWRG